MSTIMFIPMPEWQAILFLKDRKTAFTRLCQAQADVLPEVVQDEHGLFHAFRNRADAIKLGYEAYPQGFAMVRLVVHKILHGSMMFRREIINISAKHAGVDVYQLNHEGLLHLLDKCCSAHLEVLVDEIFGPCVGDPCLVKEECRHDGNCGHGDSLLDPQNPEDAGRPSRFDGLRRLITKR